MSPYPTKTTLQVRSVRADDRHLVAAVYDALSPRSRLLRFHSPLPRIPSGYVDHLARVDPGRRDGMLVFADGQPIGHGQWVRDPAHPTRADLALAVVDAWHGRGAGLALVGHLARTARLGGVTHFTAYVMWENTIVRSLLTRFGARASAGEEFEIPVAAMVAATGALAGIVADGGVGNGEVAVA